MLCQDCPKKDSCVKLCEKAERYVSQDHVSRKERTYGDDRILAFLDFITRHNWQDCSTYWIAQSVNFPFLTDLQNKCLHLFYFEGLSYRQIASRLSSANQHGVFLRLSSEGVSYQIRSAKRQILQFSP